MEKIKAGEITGQTGDYMLRATAANGQIRAFAATSRDLVEKARQAHNTSPVATAALGRLMTAGVMMGSMMKADSDLLTIRVEGDGPIGGLTVTADKNGNVKGYAFHPEVMLPPNAKGKLDAAQGNWIAFVDSDDTVEPEYLEKMHKAVLETGADFAICSSQCIDETGKTLAGGEHRLLNEFLPQEEVLRRMVVSDFQVPWNKLYRRKLLENLRYPENKAFEDTCLMPVIYARAASACGVWDFLYNYRIVTGSAMHRKTTLKTLDWVEAWYRLFDVLYQNGIRDALCAAYRPILTAVWDIWLHLTPEERKSPRMKEAFAYERTARHRLMQARGVTLKNLWAAVVCAASACSYLDLCRKRAERRQKTT